MKPIVIDNFVIETTRMCNLECSHCLRGKRQNKNFDVSILESLLNNGVQLSQVTLSGGEPTLVPDVIEQITNVILMHEPIDSIYVATNCINVTEKFVIAMLRLYAFSTEKEMCRIDLSNDYFHGIFQDSNTELLKGLSFFGKKYDTDHAYYIPIKEGYGEDIGDKEVSVSEPSIYETNDNFVVEGTVYLNCKGNLVKSCDLSYDSQDNPENIMCHYSKLREYIRKSISSLHVEDNAA